MITIQKNWLTRQTGLIASALAVCMAWSGYIGDALAAPKALSASTPSSASCSATAPPGSGSSDAPFQISTPDHLLWFKNNGSNKHFVLANSIDMSNCPWSGGRHGVFEGSFDGQDHVIDNLDITGDGKKIGFFKEIGQNGVVKNLGLTNVNVKSTFNPLVPDKDGFVGALAAHSRGSIQSTFVSGRVRADHTGTSNRDPMYAGGLVGWGLYSSTTSDVWFSGSVKGGSFTGGLFGRLDNLLERAFAVGVVRASYAGGLAGRTTSSGTQEDIINSFANVDVNGSAAAGGLVGKMELSEILRSQSFGDVTSRTRAGGLVGGFWHDGKIYDSIASGDVEVESSTWCYAGGIAGWNNDKTPTISRTIATGMVSHASGGNCGGSSRLGPIVSDEFSASHIPQAAFYVNAVAGGNTLGAQATPIELQALETYEQASPAWTIDGKIEEVADCANPSSTANLTLCPNRVPFPSTIGLLSTTNTPTNLQATPTFEGIDLSWTAPSDLGNSPIVGYRIESSVDGASWSTEVNDTRRSLTQYSLVALNPGTAYHLRVSALNAMGASTPVATTSSITAGTVPGAPTNLTIDAVRTTAVDLSWSAPSVSGAAAINDYIIEYSSDQGASWSTFDDGVSTATSASVTNLSEGTAYRFRVLAENSKGQSTPSSATTDTTVGDLPSAPTGLHRVKWAAQEVGVAWTPGDSGTGAITQFTVQYSDDAGATWATYPTQASGSDSRLVVDGLTEGESYQFRVFASNAVGDGPASEPLTEVAGLPPSEPLIDSVSVNFQGNSITLVWTPPNSGSTAISSYTIEQNINGGGWQTRVTLPEDACPGDSSCINIMTGWNAGDQIDFRIYASNSVGAGFRSGPVSASFVGATSQPINVFVPDCSPLLTVYWSRPSSLNGSTISEYKIEYSTDGGQSWSVASPGTGSTSRSYLDTNASPDNAYIYRVAAITTDGLVSPWSSPSSPASPIVYAGGCGTQSNPYRIMNWHHLDAVRQHLDAHFALRADLDETTSGYADHVKDSGTLANSGKGWAPIGSDGNPFTGSFDGEGHAISDLIIDRADEDEVGLFGATDSGGTIKNLRLLDITVAGDFQTGGLVGDIDPGAGPLTNIRVTGQVTSSSSRVGCLVGQSYGDIADTHADCTVTGSSAVGGLVGDSRAAVARSSSAGSVQGQTSVGGLLGRSLDPVQESFSRASVSGDSSVGGLIGQNMASITDAYAIGSVTGAATSTGGLVGTNGDDNGFGPSPGGNITRSYAAGTVTGASSDGAFVGESVGTVSYTENFYDRDVAGQAAATVSSATDRTTAQMIDADTFTNAGWDLTPTTGVWAIQQGSRGSYPYLQSISYDNPGSSPEVQPIPGLVALPGSPTGIGASASDGQASVSWTAPTDDGGAAITGYELTSTPGGLACTTSGIACTVTGLTNGTAYTFSVVALNMVGAGPASAASAAVTPLGPPATPTSVSATFDNAQSVVSWTAPTDDGGTGITGYEVTSAPGGLTCATAGTTACTVTGLTNGTAYTFTVSASNAVGTSDDSLPSAVITPATVPDTPVLLGAAAGDGEAAVTWSPPADDGGAEITQYLVVSFPGSLTCVAPASATSCVVDGLTNGTSYAFRVGASNVAGNSVLSGASAPVTPATTPSPPTGVSVLPGDGEAAVSWDAPTDDGGSTITGYKVTSTPEGRTCTTTGATSCTVTGLTNGTEYTFTVTASNVAGSGGSSAASNAVTPIGAPNSPNGVGAFHGDAEATVSWTAPADDGGSTITEYAVTSTPEGRTCTTSGATSCTVTGLTNGTAYTFTVTAINAEGASPPSTASNAVTPATVPGAPTVESATAGNQQASIVFSPPANTGGADITSHTATSSPGGLTGTITQAAGGQINVTGLTNGTEYTFTVTATNAEGTGAASAVSNAVTPATVPDVPTGVTATAGNAESTVSWTAPVDDGGSTITGYEVTSTPEGGTCTTTGATSCTVTGLTNGTEYTFTVMATNAQGTSAASEPSAPITLALAIDGLSYRMIAGTQTVEVTGRAPGNTDADITVPEGIVHAGASYRVARIRDRAFEVTPDENPNANNNGLEKTMTRLASRDAPATNGLASLTIADSVEMIGAYAFAGNALTRLTLPEGVSNINAHAFRNNRLTEVEFLGSFGDFSKDMFDDNPTLSKITYECTNSTGWPQTFNNGVDEVDARATNCDEVVESATQSSSVHSVPALSIGPLFILLSLMLSLGLWRQRCGQRAE